MSMLAPPFQLLEINVISAQDLAAVSKNMKAYAVAWLNPDRKLTTQIDPDGDNNPTWNEKFVFRVDDEFLNGEEDGAIMIEIYASAWLRDVLIGTVCIHLSSLLPPATRLKSSKVRFVALQVRRPSGRPQGILNIGVNLVDATLRSMPMYSEISASAVGYWDKDPKKEKPNQTPQHDEHENFGYDPKLFTLQRSQSEKNDSTINDYAYNPNKVDGYYGEDNGGSEVGMPLTVTKKGKIINANGSLCSDVGPSPSVVAAAIAKGLYPVPLPAPRTTPGNPLFQNWPHGDDSEMGMNTKAIERWRAQDVTPVYDHLGMNHNRSKTPSAKSGKSKNHRRGGARGGAAGGGKMFSCFGTALGCEFSITCGGGNRKKRPEGKKGYLAGSELTYEESYV